MWLPLVAVPCLTSQPVSPALPGLLPCLPHVSACLVRHGQHLGGLVTMSKVPFSRPPCPDAELEATQSAFLAHSIVSHHALGSFTRQTRTPTQMGGQVSKVGGWVGWLSLPLEPLQEADLCPQP